MAYLPEYKIRMFSPEKWGSPFNHPQSSPFGTSHMNTVIAHCNVQKTKQLKPLPNMF
jgi:hypothetical protein